MSKTSIIVTGATGKMGRAILRLALEASEFNVAGAISIEGNPEIPGLDSEKVFEAVEKSPASKDTVVIDFTRPEGTETLLKQVKQVGCPVVIGTTGIKEGTLNQIKEYSKTAPVLIAANMSIGMNTVIHFAGKLAEKLKGFDIDITETHHRYKVDAPSGSALAIGQAIEEALNIKHGDANMSSSGPRPQEEQPRYQSIRSGGVVGDHVARFTSDYEVVEISHRALNRYVFAAGALQAAQWINNKKPGLYSMNDVMETQNGDTI